jgi:hypothetical protein
MKRLSALVALAFVAVGCGSSPSSSSTAPTASANPVFTASLLAANEVPPVANAESTVVGAATITFITTKDSAGNVTAATVTFAVTVGGFPAGSTLNIAHIHEGPPTCVCPVVVSTTVAAGQVAVANGLASFTREGIPVDAALAQRIIANPGSFYFNIHSTLNPLGVARGILIKS